ncbi:spectrin beta chain, non-erythrocytic 4-like [Myxocyprinus asiaticus]|uniref:spectrin beta chain, non-erythrocytic 4-like n=1 Tax=Myxocyprinus asiaticus TaxID=70543 RepID=UPI0022233EFC|nr:spectrin beta chain, non-erythrocytic 4-like [Myxocyprinus asiaticus]XP_051550393.1 spectrin beta chain, non-erythrocytic 4-like [Myxocyprinus asiaticus]XP_051550403.1 spectrin beta chain, non-erythrocytic 4-like [Myxocyprinus asiaticus]
MLTDRDGARDEAQKLHRKWMKHQAFMAELARNKEWLAKIEQEGVELIQEKPELRSVVEMKLKEIQECWSHLENTTKVKARQLFETQNHRTSDLPTNSLSDLDQHLNVIQEQPPTLGSTHTTQPTLLQPRPTFSQQLQRIQSMEAQMQLYHGVGEVRGGDDQQEPEGEEQGGMVETRIVRLIEPLKERRRILLASKEMYQVTQDLEDEIIWIQERLHLASSTEYGTNLPSVQHLIKNHEALQMEMQARRSHVEEVLERAEAVAALRTPEVELVREGADHVRQLWEVLQVEMERRTVMLDAVSHAQQYYTQAAKAESWLSGQKLQVLNEEKGNDEASTLRLLKEQLTLEQTVENYVETVGSLSQQCRHMLELGHPDSEQITKQQAHIDRLYVSLKDLVEQRKTKLEQQYWLYQLKREVEALEKWISEREAIASSTELGRDLEHVTALRGSFTKFSSETRSVGQKQMDSVNKMVNEMIDCSHSDAATIAEWKDGLNESWADLLELMETRTQMLAASYQLHKFFTDCQEVLVQIEGKMRQLPEVRSCQVSSANPGTLQRLLHSFEHSLQLLVSQVRQLQENAAQLRAIYAGEKADAIFSREQEVMQAWKELLVACEGSRVQITTVTDKIQFFAVVRELSMWMDGIMGQIGSADDARDLNVLEGMMSQHQSLKSKMDNKSKNFVHCVEMGKMLLAARNPAAEEVKEKLEYVITKQKDLNERWELHWEKLQQAQQRLQSNQPGLVEQSWLTMKEPITMNTREVGGGTDEVEELIRRHEAFRKAAATWKDHFSSLRQAEKMKEEQNKPTSSLLSRQMFPLSCLVPSSSSSSSSSSLFRNPLQDSILESKPSPDLKHSSEHTVAHTLTQRLGSTLNPYTTVMNGSSYQGLNQSSAVMIEGLSYHGLKQQGVSGLDHSSYQGLNQQIGVLGVNSSSYTGLNQQGVLGENSSSYHSLNHLGAVGVVEPKLGYAWQHLKSDCLQPKINHIHKAVPPLLEAHRAQLASGIANVPAPPMGMDPSLEMIHSRLQRDPRGSRSDPQMDHLRREREYRLGRQTSSEQEIQARLNELPLIVRQERYHRRMERQSSSEKEGSGKHRIQKHDSSDADSGKEPSDKRPSGEKHSTMAEIVEQAQEREACNARGEVYRPSSSLSAPVSRLDRPRARDRPKPRRRPRPKEPEEPRRSRSAPAQSVPTTLQPPTHTVHHEGFLYRKHEKEGKERSPNSKSWVNLFCVLKQGEIGFYKDARHKTTPYNDEPFLNLAICTFDTTNGYKKKKNVFILRTSAEGDYIFLAKDEDDLKGWVNCINASLKEIEEIAKWEKNTNSSTDPDKSERKERSEGAEPSEGVERSERSEKSERSDRSDKIDASDKSSEKRDTSEKERGQRGERERGERGDRGSRGSSTSGKSK